MFIPGRSILSAAYRNKLIKAKRHSRCNVMYFNCIQWTLFDRCEENISLFDLYRRKLKRTKFQGSDALVQSKSNKYNC